MHNLVRHYVANTKAKTIDLKKALSNFSSELEQQKSRLENKVNR